MAITGSCIKQAESCKSTPLEIAPLCQGVPYVGITALLWSQPGICQTFHKVGREKKKKKEVDLMINNNALSQTLKDIIGSLLRDVNQGNV